MRVLSRVAFCILCWHCAMAATVPADLPTEESSTQPSAAPVTEVPTPQTTPTTTTTTATAAAKKSAKSVKNEKAKIIEDASFWSKVGTNQLKKIVEKSKKTKETAYKQKARNIIIFVGDGMGLTTITAGRIYKGQTVHHNNGEEEMLAFDEFPYTGLAKTYNVNKQVPDSAGTATAMFTGIKSDYGAIGVDVTRSETDGSKGKLTSIMDWAQAEGKRTGIVTTTRITHATPAATYARIYHRDWECDTEVPAQSIGQHVDIAAQLVENAPGNKFNVIFGGGLSPMGALNNNEEQTVRFEGKTENICTRGDKRNLVEEWLKIGNNTDKRQFVQTREELLKMNADEVDHVLGLFRNNHITYSVARQKGEPSLKEMTETAIKVLERGRSSSGFVLMVEGGRIDQAHHQNYARAAMQEVLELDMAVEAALKLTNADETLIIVTADHSHSVTLNGYPKRGADILGFANKSSDPIVYETITYANGPGYYDHLANNSSSDRFKWRPLEEYTETERNSPTYRHMATLPLKDETHGGEDVIVFANGPGASLVHGVFEQNYLAYIMSYAGCMGPAKHFDDTCDHERSSAAVKSGSLLLYSTALLMSLFAVIF